jgi:hypothetical protein
MARTKKAIPKFEKGRPVSQSEFIDAVLDAVDVRGVAKPIQVAVDLEFANTPEEKECVAMQLRNLMQQKLLVRVERAGYSLSSSCRLRRNRTAEAALIETIRSYGGLSTWSEIMRDFDTLPSENKDGRYWGGRGNGSQGHLSKVLKSSSRIIRYELASRKIMWGLPWDELLKLPMTGRNAEFTMTLEFVELTEAQVGRGGRQAEKELRENIEEHFDRVGIAFRKARRMYGLGYEDAAYAPSIRESLEWIKGHLPNAAAALHREMNHVAERAARLEGRIDDYRYLEQLKDRETDRALAHILGGLEMGSPEIHRLAPAKLYYDYAAAFQICPVSLSYGLVRRPLKDSVASATTPPTLPSQYDPLESIADITWSPSEPEYP